MRTCKIAFGLTSFGSMVSLEPSKSNLSSHLRYCQMSRPLLTVCALTVLTLISTLAIEGQNQSLSSHLNLVPIQQRGPQYPQKIGPVPKPDPNGPNVQKTYPPPPGQPPVSDA